jgi:FemAB-related protein (PEP-CTERM system-associated)
LNHSVNYKILGLQELETWDEYVLSHPDHSPYHLSAWGLAVANTYKHPVLFVTAYSQDIIVGVLPLSIFSVPMKGKFLCSLPYCDLGGCLANDSLIKQQMEEHSVKLKRQYKASHVEIRERTQTENDVPNWENKKVSMLLSLPPTSEQLRTSFKSKLRSQINKAEKNGLQYELGRSFDFVEDFYQIISKNMHRLGSPVHSVNWFWSIVQNYNDKCLISLIKSDGKVVSAGLILFTDKQVCIPWASTLADYNHLSPNMLLYWSLLKFSADHGCEQFDFGRSTFNEGTYRFKAQWGAKPTLLNFRELEQDEANIQPVHSSSKLRAFVESSWRKIPLPFANVIGPVIRRYISL